MQISLGKCNILFWRQHQLTNTKNELQCLYTLVERRGNPDRSDSGYILLGYQSYDAPEKETNINIKGGDKSV